MTLLNERTWGNDTALCDKCNHPESRHVASGRCGLPTCTCLRYVPAWTLDDDGTDEVTVTKIAADSPAAALLFAASPMLGPLPSRTYSVQFWKNGRCVAYTEIEAVGQIDALRKACDKLRAKENPDIYDPDSCTVGVRSALKYQPSVGDRSAPISAPNAQSGLSAPITIAAQEIQHGSSHTYTGSPAADTADRPDLRADIGIPVEDASDSISPVVVAIAAVVGPTLPHKKGDPLSEQEILALLEPHPGVSSLHEWASERIDADAPSSPVQPNLGAKPENLEWSAERKNQQQKSVDELAAVLDGLLEQNRPLRHKPLVNKDWQL